MSRFGGGMEVAVAGSSPLRRWTPRHWAVTAGGAALTALAVGIPTGIIHTPFYTRMTPVLWWNYPVWIATALLLGLILGTYIAAPRDKTRRQEGKTIAGGGLAVFAVGCPICNKLVVLAIGASGALSYFAPVQPILAVASLGLLAEALRRRLRVLRICPVGPANASASSGPPDSR